MKLKLDLHTHPWEAFNFVPPTVDIAEKIVNQIKSRGIDGIGITDHHNKEWGRETPGNSGKALSGTGRHPARVGDRDSPKGQPIRRVPGGRTLPTGRRRGFPYLCHPGYYSPEILIEPNIHAIEIDNYIHNWHIRKTKSQK
ncbi:MAG: hypothetical protein Ct9H300mP11_14990 [Chloroflexota bacterium]|nr:MAG: hypothetical protein Ct9H300mP11_14990 [Chloroflexota bacterium]